MATKEFKKMLSTWKLKCDRQGGPIETDKTLDELCKELGWNVGNNFEGCEDLFLMIAFCDVPEVWLAVPNEAPVVYVSGVDSFGEEDGFIEFCEFVGIEHL